MSEQINLNDFVAFYNQVYNAYNLVYQRADGSVISLLTTPRGYEVYDPKYEEEPFLVTTEGLIDYLEKETIRELTTNICLN